jgi:hypothetical protein
VLLLRPHTGADDFLGARGADARGCDVGLALDRRMALNPRYLVLYDVSQFMCE